MSQGRHLIFLESKAIRSGVLIAVAFIALCTPRTTAAFGPGFAFPIGTSDGGSTTFDLSIAGGDPMQFVIVEWHKPRGTLLSVIGIQLNAAGEFAGMKSSSFPAAVGVQDEVRLVLPGGVTLDSSLGTWVAGGPGAVRQVDDPAPPPGENPIEEFGDWTNFKRQLDYCVDPILDDAAHTLLAGNDVDAPIGPPFTLGDAARMSATIWNAAATGWQFNLVACGAEDILVTESNIGPPPSPGFDPEIDDFLGRFYVNQLDATGAAAHAIIEYNSAIAIGDWAISAAPFTWDAILLMLHEFGHSIRLDDLPGVVDGTNGSIMRGMLRSAVNRWNAGGPPDPNQFRNPGAEAVAGARASAATRRRRGDAMLVSSAGTDQVLRYERRIGGGGVGGWAYAGVFGEANRTDMALPANGGHDFNFPTGLAQLSNGHVLVAVRLSDRIFEYDINGEFVKVFAAPDPDPARRLDMPEGLVVGPDGNQDGTRDVYVASEPDATGQSLVLLYTTGGTLVDPYAQPSSASDPRGIVFLESAGHVNDKDLFVANGQQSQLDRLDADGTVNLFADSVTQPRGVIIGPDRNAPPSDGLRDIYVSDGSANDIRVFDGTNGAELSTFVTGGPTLDEPYGLLFGPDVTGDQIDDLYVASHNSRRVRVYSGATGALAGLPQPVHDAAGGGDVDAVLQQPTFLLFVVPEPSMHLALAGLIPYLLWLERRRKRSVV